MGGEDSSPPGIQSSTCLSWHWHALEKDKISKNMLSKDITWRSQPHFMPASRRMWGRFNPRHKIGALQLELESVREFQSHGSILWLWWRYLISSIHGVISRHCWCSVAPRVCKPAVDFIGTSLSLMWDIIHIIAVLPWPFDPLGVDQHVLIRCAIV